MTVEDIEEAILRLPPAELAPIYKSQRRSKKGRAFLAGLPNEKVEAVNR